MIYDPMVDELFAARRGAGARSTARDERLRATDLKTAAIEVGWNMRRRRAFLGLIGRVVAPGAAVTRGAPARSRSPMSRLGGATAMSRTI